MTNEQKAQRLEKAAKWKDLQGAHWKEQSDVCQSHPAESKGAMSLAEAEFADAALLRECAGMMRERGKAQWMKVAGSDSRQTTCYRGWVLEVDEGEVLWSWSADSEKGLYGYRGPTLEAAQAAAVAWVDEQEGRDA